MQQASVPDAPPSTGCELGGGCEAGGGGAVLGCTPSRLTYCTCQAPGSSCCHLSSSHFHRESGYRDPTATVHTGPPSPLLVVVGGSHLPQEPRQPRKWASRSCCPPGARSPPGRPAGVTALGRDSVWAPSVRMRVASSPWDPLTAGGRALTTPGRSLLVPLGTGHWGPGQPRQAGGRDVGVPWGAGSGQSSLGTKRRTQSARREPERGLGSQINVRVQGFLPQRWVSWTPRRGCRSRG